MITKVGLSIALLVFAAQNAQAGYVVEWDASGYLVPVLAKAGMVSLPESFGGIDAVDLVASSCHASIYRPDRGAEAEAHPENKLTCKVRSKGGDEATVAADLSQLPFSAWGNRYDKMQVQVNDVEASLALNKAFAEVFKESGKTALVSRIAAQSPDGSSAVVIYSLDVDASELSAAYMTCSTDWSWDKTKEAFALAGHGCVFHFPLTN